MRGLNGTNPVLPGASQDEIIQAFGSCFANAGIDPTAPSGQGTAATARWFATPRNYMYDLYTRVTTSITDDAVSRLQRMAGGIDSVNNARASGPNPTESALVVHTGISGAIVVGSMADHRRGTSASANAADATGAGMAGMAAKAGKRAGGMEASYDDAPEEPDTSKPLSQRQRTDSNGSYYAQPSPYASAVAHGAVLMDVAQGGAARLSLPMEGWGVNLYGNS